MDSTVPSIGTKESLGLGQPDLRSNRRFLITLWLSLINHSHDLARPEFAQRYVYSQKSEKNPISELNVFVRINDEYLILSFSV